MDLLAPDIAGVTAAAEMIVVAGANEQNEQNEQTGYTGSANRWVCVRHSHCSEDNLSPLANTDCFRYSFINSLTGMQKQHSRIVSFIERVPGRFQ